MNGKCKTIKQNYKTPRDNIGENLDSLDNDVILFFLSLYILFSFFFSFFILFFNFTILYWFCHISTFFKKIIINWKFNKMFLKSALYETLKRMRRQATDWGKIFVKDVSDKELLSQIYKEFLKLKKLKKKNS